MTREANTQKHTTPVNPEKSVINEAEIDIANDGVTRGLVAGIGASTAVMVSFCTDLFNSTVLDMPAILPRTIVQLGTLFLIAGTPALQGLEGNMLVSAAVTSLVYNANALDGTISIPSAPEDSYELSNAIGVLGSAALGIYIGSGYASKHLSSAYSKVHSFFSNTEAVDKNKTSALSPTSSLS